MPEAARAARGGGSHLVLPPADRIEAQHGTRLVMRLAQLTSRATRWTVDSDYQALLATKALHKPP